MSKEEEMVRAYNTSRAAFAMKGIGKRTKGTAEDEILVANLCMMENGKMTSCMDMVNKSFKKVIIMKVSTMKDWRKDMECILFLMVANIKGK